MQSSSNVEPYPFTLRRVARPGGSIANLPLVVSCELKPMRYMNVSRTVPVVEDMNTVTGCKIKSHSGCKGHHMTDETGTIYMIPYGFATGDETKYSDSAMLNNSVMAGEKTADDVAAFCFKKIGGKTGIARKNCNSARPTNTLRFVAIPARWDAPEDTVWLPKEVFDKGTFLFMNRDGRFTTVKLKQGSKVLVGRCPSTGPYSSIPVIAMMATDDAKAVRAPIDLCRLNNLDFDGDELWFKVPGSEDAVEELDAAFDRIWSEIRNTYGSFYGRLMREVRLAGATEEVDPVLLTTMPLEDMVDHPGGPIYEAALLKPKSWKVMGMTAFDPSYWKTWVARSMDGIVSTTMGKHGIGSPYMIMRTLTMMGTVVTVERGVVTVTCKDKPRLPLLVAPPGASCGTCPAALMKMTSVMYQEGIDSAKHGMSLRKVSAIYTLVSDVDQCYTFVEAGGQVTTSVVPVTVAMSGEHLYTKLSYIRGAATPEEMVDRSVMVVSIVEAIDGVTLTVAERVMVSVFFAFVSTKTDALICNDSTEPMVALGADWYTSLTCSDVRWVKNVMRGTVVTGDIDMTTDVSTTLGSMLLGNMPMTAPLGRT